MSAAPVVLAADPSVGTAAFTYALGGTATGSVHGACDGRALVPPLGHPGSLALTGSSAVLHVYEVLTNRSIVGSETGAPHEVRLDRSMTDEVVPIAATRFDLAWVGRAIVFEAGAYHGDTRPFALSFESEDLRAGPATQHDGPSPRFAVFDGKAVDQDAGIPGWARHVETGRGSFTARGDVSILLENARVIASDRGYVVAPDEVSRTGGPGVVIEQERARFAWLDVHDASLVLSEAGTMAYCDAMQLDIHGSFTAFAARGHVAALGRTVDFDRRELALEGTMQIRDVTDSNGAAGRAATVSRAEGTFTAVGLDFETVTGPGAATWGPAATATATGMLIVVVGAWLYTRIAEDEVLDAGERRRLYDAVVANPGIGFADLQGRLPMSSTNARYHLKLLQARGLVRVVRVQGRLHFMPLSADHRKTRRELALSADPKLRDLVARLDPAGVPAGIVVQQLRATWGLSRTGAWKVLIRAVKADVVERTVEDRRVILRPAC